jgi:hypothetical protein
MIQRLQTVYLLLVVILGALLYFLPVIQFTSPVHDGVQRMFELSATGLTELTEEYSFAADGLESVSLEGTWGLALATLLIPALSFIVIFLYRKRIWQARLCFFQAMLCMGWYGVMLVYVWFGRHNVARDWDILFGACIPLINCVLTLMAMRRILKDEAMVRAADRLR